MIFSKSTYILRPYLFLKSNKDMEEQSCDILHYIQSITLIINIIYSIHKPNVQEIDETETCIWLVYI